MADQGEKGLRGLVMISLLLSALTLVGMAVLGVLALSKLGSVSESKKEVKVIEQKPEPWKNYDLGTFTVNLADEEASRYVRAHVVMEYGSLNPEFDKEIKLRESQFKDMVNTLLNDRKAVELSTGTRRIAELGCAVALQAGVVLLDEPTSGIAQREVPGFVRVLREVRDHLGATMIVVSHDVPMMVDIADRVYVLDAGVVIAEESPKGLHENPLVVAAYLGASEDEVDRQVAESKAPAAV